MNPLTLALGSFVGLALLVTVLSGYLNRILHWDGWKARAVTWLLASLLPAGVALLDWGYLADMSWQDVAKEAVGVALSANGIFTLDIVKKALNGAGAGQPSVAAHFPASE